MMLLEAIIAGVLLGALLTLTLHLLAAAAAGRRAADARRCAIEELGNVMERVTARPWAELTTAALARKQETLSASAADELPGAELKIEVAADAKDPGAKRITATIRWQDAGGRFLAPATLTTWKYKIAEQ
jgi:hypothetical protein